MKTTGKRIIIYSMLGLMQIGMFSSVAAAAPGPLHNDGSQRITYLDRDDRHDGDRQREHDERMRREKERHESEMRRRPHEGEREWRERRDRENERHDQELRDIAALLIGIAIGSHSSDN